MEQTYTIHPFRILRHGTSRFKPRCSDGVQTMTKVLVLLGNVVFASHGNIAVYDIGQSGS